MTTNYRSTLITVSEDSVAHVSTVPPSNPDKPSIAVMQYDIIIKRPYEFTSDDVLFDIYAERKGIVPAERDAARVEWLSKGQPCLRTSPLAKQYGFGIHHDEHERIALVPMESDTYRELVEDPAVMVRPAMRSSRKS